METKPPLFDFADVAPARNDHDEGYEAALRAADAVFGKKLEPVRPAAEPAPASPAPVAGRVLPSLIEAPEPAAVAERPEKKTRKPRAVRVEKAERAEKKPAASAPPRRRPKRAASVAAPSAPVEAPPRKIAAEAPKAAAGWRRRRRPIQLRWVLGSELKAGEKWKRRLPEAAR